MKKLTFGHNIICYFFFQKFKTDKNAKNKKHNSRQCANL